MTNEVGDYTIDYKDVLGEGSFGRVYKGRHKDTGELVAAKNIILKWHNVEWVNQELEIINSIGDHDNILKGLYNKKDDRQVWIILEYCDKGNLSIYAARSPLDLFSKLDIVHQSTTALVHLLGLKPTGVVHRDIKPENILLKSTATGFQVKVCDFGISRKIDATAMETKCGTHHFKAPELFEEEPNYTKAVDVFALGILILHLLRAGPGQNLECEEVRGDPVGELLKRILKLTVTRGNGRKRTQQEKWNPVVFYMDDCEDVILLKRLVVTMLSADQSRRPTMEQVHEEVGRIKLRVKSTVSRYDAASPDVGGGKLVTDRMNASEVEGSIVQPQSSMENMQEDINRLRKQLHKVEQAYRQSQQENNHLKSRQEKEKQNLTMELENALKENSNLKEQVQKATSIHERALKENKNQILQKEEVEQNYKDSKQAIHKLTMDLEDTLKENSNLKEQIQKATNIHERTLKENKKLILQKEEVEQNYKDSKQAIHKLTMDLEDTLKENSNLKEQIQKATNIHERTLKENKKQILQKVQKMHEEDKQKINEMTCQLKNERCENIIQENNDLTRQLDQDQKMHEEEQTKSRREQKAEESPGSVLQDNERRHSSTVMHRIHSIRLDYRGHQIAAFSPQHIVMGIVDSSELVCYNVSDTIKFAWRKRLSSSFSSDCRKHVMSSLFLYQSDLSTEILSLHALQDQTSHPAGRGSLRAALPGERLLYARGGRSYINLEMHDLSGRNIATLTPPRGKYKTEDIAASCHPNSGELVVVNKDEQSFDIYSNQYVFKRRCALAFKPESITSVVALEDFIIILNFGRDKVHIHNWLGEEVDVVDGFQLGLPEDGRKIHGIGQGPPGTILVAAGKDNMVQTLNLFKVVKSQVDSYTVTNL